MVQSIFVNLPVKDLPKSMAFWKALGFSFNDQFTDETAASLVMSEHIYAMLLTHAKFGEFTAKKIVDTKTSIGVINCLGLESRDAVDAIVAAALKAGGSEPRPVTDYGFMYQRVFEDLDGHTWEVIYMNPAHVQ